MKHFLIDGDRRYVIPVLKAAFAKNPQLLFFASPWSPPKWMKSSGTMIGGRLLPEHYAAYAAYFVKFVQAYEREGIPIYAVTVQNEPGVDRQHDTPKWHYPTCRWSGAQVRDFIRDHLGPAFKKHGLTTRIWCYDHNPVFADYYRQMRDHLARAAADVREAEAMVDDRHRLTFDAESVPIQWFYHTARTHANSYESCQLRDAFAALVNKPERSPTEKADAAAKLARWKMALDDKLANTKESLPLHAGRRAPGSLLRWRPHVPPRRGNDQRKTRHLTARDFRIFAVARDTTRSVTRATHLEHFSNWCSDGCLGQRPSFSQFTGALPQAPSTAT